ncbi:MAG: signal peptide peptidase SppA [Planctomycetota bacterium]|jgi:protease-4
MNFYLEFVTVDKHFILEGQIMEYEQQNNSSAPFDDGQQQRQEPIPIAGIIEKPREKGKLKRILFGIFFTLSVLGNIFLFLMLVGLAALIVSGPVGILRERVLVKGPSTSKIVVINLQGVIMSMAEEDIREEISAAKEDISVKGVILRVNSPGGTITASDQIYHHVLRFREQTGKPVVAFMEGMAASGGYYGSVACDRIVAQPTTITGSVGVIMNYFVIEELLETKLGIEPVIIKSGLKKDWPSSFQKPSEEQLQYLDEKLVQPAYERFVNIVAEGRDALSVDDVKRLADGSIYGAQEALDENMIDEIGYFEDAVSAVLLLAGITNAKVVEYQRPFSMMNLFGSQLNTGIKFDRKTLYELMLPQALYLCDVAGGN